MAHFLAVVVQRYPSTAQTNLEIERVQNVRGDGQLHQGEAASQRIADIRVNVMALGPADRTPEYEKTGATLQRRDTECVLAVLPRDRCSNLYRDGSIRAVGDALRRRRPII